MSSKIIVTVLGKDQSGIVAKVSSVLADNSCNIEDISQTLMNDIFSMVMLIAVDEEKLTLGDLKKLLVDLGEKLGLQITVQHEDVFKFMHRV